MMYRLKGKIWLYPGETASWHFVNVDKKTSEALKKRYAKIKRGWGSLPVEVTLGNSTWTTSIFPDKRSGMYLLPLKASIRQKEVVGHGETISFSLKVLA